MHIGLCVNDVEQSLRFYCDGLGFEPAERYDLNESMFDGLARALEVDAPASPLVRAGYDVWFTRAVPVIGAALSDADAYRYLPRSVAYLPPAAELRRLLGRAGYSAVGIRPLAGGLSQLVVATRAGMP